MWFGSDIRFRVIANHCLLQSFPRFQQPRANSIEFIKTGHISLVTEERTIDLRGPVLFWMHAGKNFRFVVEPDSTLPCEHLYFDFFGQDSVRIVNELDRLCPEGFLVPAEPEKINDCFLNMVEYFHLDNEYYMPELMELMTRVLVLISRAVTPPRTFVRNHYNIQALADTIRRDPFREYDFELLARKAGCSYAHFRRLFRKQNQLAPHLFLIRQKMLRASEMLQTTDLLVKEIMYSCGYDSMMDFSRTFKRYFGLCPTQFRQKCRQEQTGNPAK